MGGQFMKGVVVGAVVAAVVTMAGTALAGNGVGAVFNLGVRNSAKAPTILAGKSSDRVLRVRNNGAGAALGLKVAKNVAPLTVNSSGLVKRLNADKLDGMDAGAILAATGDGGYVEFPISNPYKVATIAGFGAVWASPEDGGSVYLLASADIYNGKTTLPKGEKKYLATDMDSFTGPGSTFSIDMLWAGGQTATQWRHILVNGDGHPMVGFQYLVN